MTVLCLNHDARQFGIAWPPRRFIGADMLILAPGRAERAALDLQGAFAGFEPLPDQAIRHAGRVLRKVAAFAAHNLLEWPG